MNQKAARTVALTCLALSAFVPAFLGSLYSRGSTQAQAASQPATPAQGGVITLPEITITATPASGRRVAREVARIHHGPKATRIVALDQGGRPGARTVLVTE